MEADRDLPCCSHAEDNARLRRELAAAREALAEARAALDRAPAR